MTPTILVVHGIKTYAHMNHSYIVILFTCDICGQQKVIFQNHPTMNRGTVSYLLFICAQLYIVAGKQSNVSIHWNTHTHTQILDHSTIYFFKN